MARGRSPPEADVRVMGVEKGKHHRASASNPDLEWAPSPVLLPRFRLLVTRAGSNSSLEGGAGGYCRRYGKRGPPFHPSQDNHGTPAHQHGWEMTLDRKAQRPRSSPGVALSRTKVRSAECPEHFAPTAYSR